MRLSRGGSGTALSTALALSSATLSGGMQLAATDGYLPQRITGETPIIFTNIFPAGSEYYDSMIFDPDGIHIWTAHYALNSMKKRRISDQAVILTVTPTGALGNMTMVDYDGVYFYAACHAQSKLTKVKYSDGSYVVHTSSNSNTAGWGLGFSLTTSPTLAWGCLYSGAAAVTEYTIDGAATGRSITAAVQDLAGSIEGGVAYIYILTTTSVVTKYKLSDLSTVYTWTLNNDYNSWPGHAYTSGFCVALSVDASTGTPYIFNSLNGSHIQLTTTGGTGAAAVVKRITAGSPELRGATAIGTGLVPAGWFRGRLGIDPTGRYWSYVVSLAAISTDSGFVLVNKQLQRARFSNTFSAACTLISIAIPNYTGNTWDGSSAGLGDQRRVIFYYAINGGARTAFIPGNAISVSIARNDVLTVDMDLIETTMGLGAASYISGPVTLYYTPT